MARKNGVASLNNLLPPHLRVVTEEPDVTWVARTPLLKIKPIFSSDPVMFLRILIALLKSHPNLKIYIFKITRK
jgi:hypothetical protein